MPHTAARPSAIARLVLILVPLALMRTASRVL